MNPPHLVSGPFTFKGQRLTFSVTDAAVALQYWDARENGADVTVTLTQPEGPTDVTGKVRSVEFLPAGERPSGWQVVIQVSEPSR